MSQFFRFYQRSLVERPILTNAITTGFLFGSGDVLAQTLFPLPPGNTNGLKPRFDYARTLRSVIYGGCIFSFIGDKWYKFLSANIKLPPGTPPVLTNVAKMAVDQLMFAPVGIPLYYTMMSVMELKTISEIKEKLEKNWWSTLKANWLVWPAFQFLNFNYVPVRHNLLTVNLFSILWNTFLSFKNSGGIVALKEEGYDEIKEIA